MKKDFFNDKIKAEYVWFMIFTIVFISVIMLVGGTALLYVSVFAENVKPENCRCIVFVASMICYAFAVVYPILSIYLIRVFPKHKKITYLLVKKSVFVDKKE